VEQPAPRFFVPEHGFDVSPVERRGVAGDRHPDLGDVPFLLAAFRRKKMDAQTFFSRGVAEAVVKQELMSLLEQSPRPLRIKFGVDPSSPDLTLGHVVCFRKLRQLQQMGHRVIVVVGDWTARIGDPSGRSKTRRMLDAATVHHNAESYLDQFFRFVDPGQTEVRFQSEWFGEFGLQDVIVLTSRFTVAQMMARDDFRARFCAGRPISIAELLYALLQAFDSVALRADIELGGNDQLFNVLVGRTIMKEYGLPPQHVITVPILVGTDGVEKMGKSTGNFIAVTAPPAEMFGALMSLPDTAMHDYWTLLTDLPEAELTHLEREMAAGDLNPRDVKLRLAREIVGAMHSADGSAESSTELDPTELVAGCRSLAEVAAQQAEAEFVRVFSQRKTPTEMPTFVIHQPMTIVEVLVASGLARSKSEARRLVKQGGVRLNGLRVSDIHAQVALPISGTQAAPTGAAADEVVLRVGRRRFLRLASARRKRENDGTNAVDTSGPH
jgi:tyrosyl-tRNA synthetase